MKSTFAVLAFAASALASPAPQGVTSAIAPSSTAPSGCQSSTSGKFEISVVKTTAKVKRQDGTLTLSLQNGKLTDQSGRTGYIAANYQFQFDSPPQTGAIYTEGFSLCANNSLALGGSTQFYQCISGDFYNLYDRNWAPENCEPIDIVALTTGGASSAGASQASDGQPQASSALPPVSQISDGQPQASSAKPIPVTQLSDGQPQAPTSVAVISQISDGQPQAPTSGAVVTQISDGQPQAPTSAAVITQISDGQPQAPTSGAVITQISDGQPQAPTSGAVITQISDGQPQAPTSAGLSTVAVAPANGTITTAQPSQFTGAAAAATGYGLGAAAAVMGVVALF